MGVADERKCSSGTGVPTHQIVMRASSVFSPGSAPSRSVSRLSIASRGRSSRACGRGRPLARTEALDAAGGVGEKLGVVIVDHGSRRKASNELLEEFVRMYREQTGRSIVELAHMEIAEPDIDTAFGRCVEQGATLVAISPFFLSPGKALAGGHPGARRRGSGQTPRSRTLRGRTHRNAPTDGRNRRLEARDVSGTPH